MVNEDLVAEHLLFIFRKDKCGVRVRDSDACDLAIGASGDTEHAKNSKYDDGRC
jgi:hypothetical protein